MIWQFRNTGLRTGAFNMAYDEQLAQALVRSDEPCVVRVYGWLPAAISIGWHQAIEDIDRERCAREGIDVVRRPTGGRAILHADEVTYSVAMLASQKSVLTVYQQISEALVCGLRQLVPDVALEKSQPHFPSLYRSQSSVACFASAARYEILRGGRKLVGSAQRRYARRGGQEIVLQHGSILLGPSHERMVDFLAGIDDARREQLRNELRQHTVDLSTALNRKVDYDEVAGVLRWGFEKSWGIVFSDLGKPEALPEAEVDACQNASRSADAQSAPAVV